MAKSNKLEDYWKQHHVENLFKDLTHLLVQNMPVDPAAAIVQYLQKKFPKSFRASSINDDQFSDLLSRSMGNSLKSKMVTNSSSKHHDTIQANDREDRRSPNQSQISGIAPIPSAGSAFTNLLKQKANSINEDLSSFNLKNLLLVNRVSQQAVKLGKDLVSHRDIIDEELIRPTDSLLESSATSNNSSEPMHDDSQNNETHQEPSVLQLIKYKQQIRLDNDRRLHHKALASLAKHQWDIERAVQYDQIVTPINVEGKEINQDQQINEENMVSQVVSGKSARQTADTAITTSKEEEEILNDEDLTLSRNTRHRIRISRNQAAPRMKMVRSPFSPMVRFDICKKCSMTINEEQSLMKNQFHLDSIPNTNRPVPLPISTDRRDSSGALEDDWFESVSDISGPRQISPWSPDDDVQSKAPSEIIQKTGFQPIKDRRNSTEQDNLLISNRSFNPDRGKSRKSTSTPRMSETGMFTRSSDGKLRRVSLTRTIPSPVLKKRQTTQSLETSQVLVTNERRMSGWGVAEHSSDDEQ